MLDGLCWRWGLGLDLSPHSTSASLDAFMPTYSPPHVIPTASPKCKVRLGPIVLSPRGRRSSGLCRATRRKGDSRTRISLVATG